MKIRILLIVHAIILLHTLNIVAQESISPKCERIIDETINKEEPAMRMVWSFDNAESCKIEGEASIDFTCFGVGVHTQNELSSLDISIEYRIGNENWKKTEIEYTPEEIERDDLYWTNLNFSENSDPISKFELKISVPSGSVIDSVKMHIINVDFKGEPATSTSSPKSTSCPAYPTVITRAVWLDPYYTQPAYTPSVISPHHVVIHHGASPDTYTDGAAIVRSYWYYHVYSNGWSDIGYNYLTDKYGNIYKGRMNSDPANQDCRGAHAGASNNESIGLNFLGNSDVTLPTEVQLDAAAEFMGWWFTDRGYDPSVSANITLQSGGTGSVPRICGHKDVNIGGTTCPGGALYADLPDLRNRTVAVISACNSLYIYGTSDGDFIDGVELDGEDANDISNTGSGTVDGPSYNDYSSTHSADLLPGSSYTLTLTNGDYGDETLAAWIDYDDDGSFEESEKIGEVIDVGASGIVTIDFTVPEELTSMTTKMRVRCAWSDYDIDATSVYAFGEAEDYEINIVDLCTTPGTPVSLVTSGIGDDIATFSWSAGSPAGSATVVYYWAVGFDGSNPTYSANYIEHGYTSSLSATTSVALDPNTDYEWRVKAHTSCDATQSDYSTAVDFTTSCTTPGVPQSLAESDIENTGAVLSWSANSTAGTPTVTYYWSVNTSSTVDYESNYVQRGYTTGLSDEVYSLSPGTTYYWTVRAETSCGVGSSSSYAGTDNFVTTAISMDITWTGATSTEWNLASNWSPAQIPTVLDNVDIPDVSAGSNRYPVTQYNLGINNAAPTRQCKSLTISENASVTLTGGSSVVIVEGELELFGTLNHECGSNSNLFEINSGGVVNVYENGVLNIGSSSFSGVPGGTINEFNDIYLNGGTLYIAPGGEVYVMDNLVVLNSGTLDMEGGELWIKYYGDGSANSLGFDVYGAATINVSDGDIYLCGQDNGASAKMADWNSSATMNITGGTIHLYNEQSSGTNDYTGYCNFGGHAINNLYVNRSGATTYNLSGGLDVNGDFILTSGTFDLNSYDAFLNGDVLNNGGTLVAGSGIIYLEGADKTIGGNTASQMDFNDVIFSAGANYTFNPTVVNNFDFNGSFDLQSGSTLNISTGDFIDLYSSTAEGEYIKLNGTVNSSDNYNNSQEFDFNNTCDLYILGDVQADLRIFDDITTLKTFSTLYGDIEMYDGGTTASQGTLELDGSAIFTLYGDFINNYGLVPNTSYLALAGDSKEISGDSDDDYYNITILSGASYTLNPSSTNGDIDVNGQFEMEEGSSLEIASGKYLDLYTQDFMLDSIILNGDIIATDAYDGTRDIDINNTVDLSGSGNINADLRIFDNITTLSSDFVLDGDFETYNNLGSYQGTFVMTDQELTINGDFINDYRFDRGTGTVIFSGLNDQIVDCGCSNSDCDADAEDINYRRLNNVIVECDAGASVETLEHMRVEGDFTVNSGTFTTGDALGGKKINIYGISTIEDGAFFNVGNSVFNSGDVADFHNNLIVRGQITTDRDIIDGYSEVRTYASRLYAEGDADEVNADVQVYLDDATLQLSDLYISGDLIVQSANEFKCTGQNLTLTIGGNLYIYHNFTHYGTVNLYGNFRENTLVGWEAEICDMATSTFNMYGDHFINFSPSSGFGNLNIMSGTRSINETGGQTPYTELDIKGNLTIEDGATLDAGTDLKDIDIEGNWIVEGTGAFVEGIQKVIFSASDQDQYIYIDPSASCVFYQMDVDNTYGNLILQSDVEVDRQIDLYTGGISLEGNTLYLSGSTNSINSFMDGGSYNGYIISEYTDNSSIFKRNFGTSSMKYYPFADISGNSLAMIIENNNSGVDDLGDVSIATYPTNGDNNPLPSSVDHLTTDILTTDTYNQLVDRFWQIDAGGTVNDVDITFTYVDNSWDSFDMTAQRWNGSDWDPAPATSTHNTTDNTVTVSNITGFSPWVLVKKDWQLPVELLSFNAERNEGIVDISWQTANEFNNDYFEVERSIDLLNTEVLAKVQGAGFTNNITDYYIADKSPYSGISYYRLKQVDFDGTYTYSDWVAVEFRNNTEDESVFQGNKPVLSVLSAYPNPTRDIVKVLFSSSSNQDVKYYVYDYTGRLIDSGKYHAFKGDNVLELNFNSYQNGVYIFVISSETDADQIKIIRN